MSWNVILARNAVFPTPSSSKQICMMKSFTAVAALCLTVSGHAGIAAATAVLEQRQVYALAGDGFDNSSTILGNYYNYWNKLSSGTFDLTRRDVMPVTSPKTLPFFGSRSEAIIEPNRTALVIIDMQNYFLHPQLSPAAKLGRKAVQPTVNMINGFRKHNMKILWTQWGLTEYDRLTIPPSFISGFTTNGSDIADQSFGSNMGEITDNGTTIQVGRKLMRGSWNAEPYGVLGTMKDEGLAAGTDFYFNKNRLSGLWGPQTPLGIWLQENEVTTLFFGGVNADQCVWSKSSLAPEPVRQDHYFLFSETMSRLRVDVFLPGDRP